jgi:hypothetical protein
MSQYVSVRANGFSIQLLEFMNSPSFMIEISDIVLEGFISESCFPHEYEDKVFITEVDYKSGMIEILAYSVYKKQKSQKWILQTNLPELTAHFLKTHFNVIDMDEFTQQLEQ